VFTEDLSVFFNSAEHATDALWSLQGGGSFTIQVIFDNGYTGYGVGEVDQAGRGPRCMVRDDQIAQGVGMKRGDTLAIGAVTYKVGNIEAEDQPGVSWLVLKK
jgi:hypothetical protein